MRRPPCPRDPEQGAQTLEWLGVGAVVVALVASVVVAIPDVGNSVGDAISSLVCRVVGEDCEAGEGGQDVQAGGQPGDQDEGDGAEPGGGGGDDGGGDDGGGGGGLLDGVGDFLGGVVDGAGDVLGWAGDQVVGFGRGFVEGVVGMGQGLWLSHQLSISRAIYDPQGWLQSWEELGQTALYAKENPGEFGKALINWEDLAAGEYGEWLGNLAPDVILTIATSGAGGAAAVATRGTRAADAVADLADAAQTAGRLRNNALDPPDSNLPRNRPDGDGDRDGQDAPDCPTGLAAPASWSPATAVSSAAVRPRPVRGPATETGQTAQLMFVAQPCGDGDNDNGDTNDDNPGDPTPPDFTDPTFDTRKLTEYALNPNHPRGKNKARVIESATGLDRDDAATVRRQILEQLDPDEAQLGVVDQYGTRWNQDVQLTGPDGTITVRTAWIVDAATGETRFVTLSFP